MGLLWIQEKEEEKELEFFKIKGEFNPADLMTKHLQADKAKRHTEKLAAQFLQGRAETGLKVQGEGGGLKDGRTKVA